jgi:spoIIIJ-associated protein
MEWIEVTGRTIEDAKELALDRLGVVEDELEYEIVDEPKSSMFGLRRTDARIRARVKPLSREKPGERRRRRGRQGGGGRTRRESAPARASAGAGGGARPASTAATRGDGLEVEPTAGGREAADATASDTSRRDDDTRSRDGDRPRRRRRRSTNPTNSTSAADAPVAQEESPVEDEVPIEEQAEAAAAFTTGLVEAFGVPARVVAEVRDDAVHVEVEGENLGLLVGPRGATLAAVEEIVRAVVQRAAGGHSARVHVDVGGYRQRRREALAEFARRLAAEVQNEGAERALEPMSPPDRKVVHDTVAEIDGVVTVSLGEEPRRRVVIRPA